MMEIERLRQEIERLNAENLRLKDLLKKHGISSEPSEPITEATRMIDAASEKERRIGLFMRLFCARKEFYAER